MICGLYALSALIAARVVEHPGDPIVAAALMAAWSGAVSVAVLTDNQLTDDIAAGVVLAIVLLPVFLSVCLLGLLVWPLIRLMNDDPDRASEDGPLSSER